ncbi:hypothetical protein [Cupriavidus necator]|nr:hypothetical protein [Cupriavidus necator]
MLWLPNLFRAFAAACPADSVCRLVRCCAGMLLATSLSLTAAAADSRPATLMFKDFTVANGAMTVFAHGDYVEPYTAIYALLVAHRLGVDVRTRAAALAQWLLPYQQADGPFPRICRSGDTQWVACGPADADDSLAVFWCLLASEVLKGDRALEASCGKSLENLATLWDPQRATFRARFGRPEAYFADNVEVIGALGKLRARSDTAARYARELSQLPSQRLMLDGLARSYGYNPAVALEPARATLPPAPYGFYPNVVAPVYLWLCDVTTGSQAARQWAVWKHRHAEDWLAGKSDHYPWGVIALAAYQAGDRETAAAWLKASAAWRAQGRWNVLEEGVRIGLLHAMPDTADRPNMQ